MTWAYAPNGPAAHAPRRSTPTPAWDVQFAPYDTIPHLSHELKIQDTSVRSVEFSRDLRDEVLAGDITLSVRLWKRPQVREGGRYRVGPGLIEIDAIELVPFAAITEADVRRAGEPDRESLRDRAAHAGPIDEDTLVYRTELHAVSPDD